MDGRAALDLATERALQELGAGVAEETGPAKLEAAKRLALAAAQSGDLAEARDAIRDSRERVANAAGLIVPQVLIGAILERGSAPNGKKKALRRRLDAAFRREGFDAVGCLEIPLGPSGMAAYVALGECAVSYDLGTELNRISLGLQPAGGGALPAQVRTSIGALIQCGRQAYAAFVAQNAGLIADIIQVSNIRVDPRKLLVRHEDTTLYLDEVDVRVGIHVTVAASSATSPPPEAPS